MRLAIAAVLVVSVSVAAITVVSRLSDGSNVGGPSPSRSAAQAVDVPNLTTTFVSPRNGFSISHPDNVTITPAVQLWGSEAVDNSFDVIDTRLSAVFKGASTGPGFGGGGSVDERVDEFLSGDAGFPGGCGVPRGQQAEITIDGQPGRIAECPNRLEATVVAGGRLYLFTLEHDRRDARAVFDAFVATIHLTPETAIEYPSMTKTFVSPTYGYSFKYGRGLVTPATEVWDPDSQPLADLDFDPRFDGLETGYYAYFEGASTPLPDGVSIDEWVDEYVTRGAVGGCGVPRRQQAEITIDGQPGRIAQCGHSEATVVSGGRLYLFTGPHDTRDWFEAWIATIDLRPEDAAVRSSTP